MKELITMKEIYCFDFDGVIHPYSKGYQDGSIYDELNHDVLKLMVELMKEGNIVVICSARSKYQIKKHFDHLFHEKLWFSVPFKYKLVPSWSNAWTEKDVVGISNRKLIADYYIDDKAVLFKGDIKKLRKELLLK